MIALLLAAAMTVPGGPSGGETALDRPWADIGRAAAAAPDAPAALEILRSSAPALVRELEADARRPAMLSLWGQSLNFDEHARATIVAPHVLEAFASVLGLPAPRGEVGHAGMTHSYGYVFSVLKTPYGFKRQRWVSGELEAGLGLPPGTFAPVPPKGTLLSNLTGFLGGIAFRGDERERWLAAKPRRFDLSRRKPRRLSETVTLPDGRSFVLRTDLVPYLRGDGSLLVYSYRDVAAARAFLITAFPVAKAFADSLLDPKTLGEGRLITTRYNGYVDGVTGVPGLTGSRRAE